MGLWNVYHASEPIYNGVFVTAFTRAQLCSPVATAFGIHWVTKEREGGGRRRRGRPPGTVKGHRCVSLFSGAQLLPRSKQQNFLKIAGQPLSTFKGSNATMQLACQNRLPEAMRSLCGASPEWSLCKASSLRRAWFPGASAEPPRR